MLRSIFTKYNFLLLFCLFYAVTALKAEETTEPEEENYSDTLVGTMYMDTLIAGMHFIEDMVADDKNMVSDRVLTFKIKGSEGNFHDNTTGGHQKTSYKGAALEYRIADVKGLKIDQFTGYYQADSNNSEGDKNTGLVLGFNSYYVTRKPYLFDLRYYAQATVAGTFMQIKRKGFNQEGGIGLYKLSTLASNISGETGFVHSDDKRFFKTGVYYQKIYLGFEDIKNDVVKLSSEPFSGHVFGYEVYDEMIFFQKGFFASSINIGAELKHTSFSEVGFVGSYYTADQEFTFMPTIKKLNETRYLLRTGLSVMVKDFSFDAYYLYSNAIQSNTTQIDDKYHFVTGKLSYNF